MAIARSGLSSCLTIAALFAACYATPYSEYILAPSSRELTPVSVYQVNGSVSNAAAVTKSGAGKATFNGSSSVTYDYGVNIAGVVSVTVGSSTSEDAFIGLTFSESSLWINSQASDATADAGLDAVLWLPVGEGPGTYTVDRDHERGGFRYLTVVSNTSASVEVTGVTTNFTAAPVMDDLQAYTGYFHSDDELLNRIWYAGAYTNQLCTIDPTHGDSLVHFMEITSADNITLPETVTWWNNFTITNGTSCTVDGAKRDRLVWPGDMAISIPAITVSTYDTDTIKNSLESLLILQKADGMLPYAGIPFSTSINATSFTYHLYNLIALSYYSLYSGDLAYMETNWGRFTDGLAWSLSYVDETGLMNVTSSADWLRNGMGGHNIEANAILYYTLNLGLQWAEIVNDSSVVSNWTTTAAGIKTAANELLWDETTGLYTDNETTTLSPQDGNAWAIKANLTLSSDQAATVASALQARWGAYGAPAPEAGTTVSPFISGFEAEAHFLVNNASAALDLFRLEWGFMLNDPRMTNSTFIEGYATDGSLVYSAYKNDPRISHAHGWATAPTSLLSTYVAGIHIEEDAGKKWRIAPQLGDLNYVDAGFSTALGSFSVEAKGDGTGSGKIKSLAFCTPSGTSGTFELPGYTGTLKSQTACAFKPFDGVIEGLMGGCWEMSA